MTAKDADDSLYPGRIFPLRRSSELESNIPVILATGLFYILSSVLFGYPVSFLLISAVVGGFAAPIVL